MKKRGLQLMSAIHTWSGVVIGWLLFIIFLTGTVAVFRPEITHWMQPEVISAKEDPANAFLMGYAYLEQNHPKSPQWTIQLPTRRDPGLSVQWGKERQKERAVLDPNTGQEITPRATQGGRFFTGFHSRLNSREIGTPIVFGASILLLLAIITGLLIHKRLLSDFFTFRPRSGTQRRWLDLHIVTGVIFLPFLAMITYTGAAILFPRVFSAPVEVHFENTQAYRSATSTSFKQKSAQSRVEMLPLTELWTKASSLPETDVITSVTIDHPNDQNAQFIFAAQPQDRIAAVANQVVLNGTEGKVLHEKNIFSPGVTIQRGLVGWHVGRFGGSLTQWIYFISGFMATLTIGTGMLLFSFKRKKKSAQEFGVATRFVYQLIEKMNLCAIVGSFIAIAAYFWANRLLPTSLTDRASWEVYGFFGALIFSFIHAWLRPTQKAWGEQTILASFLFLCLPLVNLLTTGQSIVSNLMNAEIARMTFDLMMLAFGAFFAFLFWQITQKMRNQEELVI